MCKKNIFIKHALSVLSHNKERSSDTILKYEDMMPFPDETSAFVYDGLIAYLLCLRILGPYL